MPSLQMTTAELIDNVLASIRGQFYADRLHDFFRDKHALRQALATWGYECHQRSWDFDAPFILRELMTLLNEIKRSGASFDYLPTYLGGAIKRRIGQRAEELSAAWKAQGARVNRAIKIVQGDVVTAVVEPTTTEVLATLYQAERKAVRARKAKSTTKVKQGELL